MKEVRTEINKLLSNYSADEIEAGLVNWFIVNNDLHVKNNNLLIKIQNKQTDKKVASVIMELNKLQNKKLSIHDVVMLSETLIPSSDQKINGAFYTPEFISDYINQKAIITGNEIILDPACGCGALLVNAAVRIHKLTNKTFKSIIENQIHGYELAQYSVNRSKLLLSLLALSNGEDIDLEFNLKCVNSLGPEITKIKNKFDVIIGNPPYVKYQDLPASLRNELNADWKTTGTGNYNLYFPFFELGIDLVKDNGKVVYITPNSFITSNTGKELRLYLAKNEYLNEIIDFTYHRVFEVQTYTAITTLNKKSQPSFVYKKIVDNINDDIKAIEKIPETVIRTKSLVDENKWILVSGKDQARFKQMQKAENILGDIASIHVGIATNADSFYLLDGEKKQNKYVKEFNGIEYLIEPGITKIIRKVPEVKSEIKLKENKRAIIYPYVDSPKKSKPNIIKEEIIKSNYPGAYSYLLAIKDVLIKRDKGLKEYPTWYAYARSQGLNNYGRKILNPFYLKSPRFIIDHNENSLFVNGYGIFLKEEQGNDNYKKYSLELLQKILNSESMDFYMRNTSTFIDGGYLSYSKSYMQSFPLPELSNEDIKEIMKTGDQQIINKIIKNAY